jgi:hypothetical protein
MLGESIVLVNRTPKPLNFTFDGRSFSLKPGTNYGFHEVHEYFAKAQNPLMGSEDYLTLNFVSLVGVDGKDDCEPIPVEVLNAAKEAERFDIETLTPAAKKNRTRLANNFRQSGRVASAVTANTQAIGE